MPRIGGRFGRVYLGVTTSAEASELPFVGNWSLNASTDKIDVTAMGDAGKVYVAGLPDQAGEIGGFMDDASATMYAAALDGLARKFYLYPTVNVPTLYFFGTILCDANFSADVNGAVTMSGSWAAATTIAKRP